MRCVLTSLVGGPSKGRVVGTLIRLHYWASTSDSVPENAAMIQLANPLIAPIRRCDLCGDQMRYLGEIPGTVKGPGARIFRCNECALVTSEHFDESQHVPAPTTFGRLAAFRRPKH
jgi:hypothetical protein